jgi:NAD(P)-dependent dehydrogenase (short-subunit alcohol dehydrogenase family)
MKNWFITGCSTGLGKALCEYLLPKGYKVAATVRNLESLTELKSQYPDTLWVYQLDVQNTAAIHDVVAESIADLGQIDVVVNNAGYGLVGNIEGMGEAQIRAQMETNFFACVFISQAFMPHFRAIGGGCFMHVSSIAGVNVSPGAGIYSASKFALEGFSEGLMREGAAVNITSTCIEPGPFRTDWAGRSLVFAEKEIAAYEPTVGRLHDYLTTANGNQKGDPAKAAWAMEQVSLMEKPPFRMPLGNQAYNTVNTKLEFWKNEHESVKAITTNCDFEG